MNRKILDIVNNYSIEFNFETNLEDLIKSLHKILNKNKNKNKIRNIPLEYNDDELEYNGVYKNLNTKQQNLFKEMFDKTKTVDFTIDLFTMKHRCHGADDSSDYSIEKINRYNITYSLNNYEIKFTVEIVNLGNDDDIIELSVENKNNNDIIALGVEIIDILKYTDIDHTEELGEYQKDGETGLIYCNQQNASNFYHEFNNNLYKTSGAFYNNLLSILLSSIVHKLSARCENVIEVGIGYKLEDLPYDNSYILK
jgi:hypothetical protein